MRSPVHRLPHPRLRRSAALLATAAVLLGLAYLPPHASAAVPSCARAGSQFEPGSLARLRWKTKCLLDRARLRRGIPRLRYSRRLRRSAKAHGLDMVHRAYFSHSAPGQTSLGARIARAGYMAGARRWAIGENLGWLAVNRRAARTMVRLWLRSPGHRDLILERRFRDVGLSIVRGAPGPYSGSALTFVLHFGRRW